MSKTTAESLGFFSTLHISASHHRHCRHRVKRTGIGTHCRLNFILRTCINHDEARVAQRVRYCVGLQSINGGALRCSRLRSALCAAGQQRIADFLSQQLYGRGGCGIAAAVPMSAGSASICGAIALRAGDPFSAAGACYKLNCERSAMTLRAWPILTPMGGVAGAGPKGSGLLTDAGFSRSTFTC
jgi:hypothetical protein